MTHFPQILIHVLAVDAPANGKRIARGTVRVGEPRPGMRLRIAGSGERPMLLTVDSLSNGERWTTFVLSGNRENLDQLLAGSYLFGDSHAQAEREDGRNASLRSRKEEKCHNTQTTWNSRFTG